MLLGDTLTKVLMYPTIINWVRNNLTSCQCPHAGHCVHERGDAWMNQQEAYILSGRKGGPPLSSLRDPDHAVCDRESLCTRLHLANMYFIAYSAFSFYIHAI